MHGVIYGDLIAHLVGRTAELLSTRPEPYAADVEVSNRKSSSARRAVVLSSSPGGGAANTLRTSYVTVDVIADDEADAIDLMNLVLALLTSRGAGGMVDGRPVIDASINGGPNADPAADGSFKQTAELELQHRGRNL